MSYNPNTGGAETFLELTDTPETFSGQAGKFPKVNAGATALEFAALAGGGDMLAANNLSDVANVATARGNLGVETTAAILLQVYPVGAIYTSVVSTSPATLFGGTWSAFGAGRVLVGIDAGQTEFDTVEETGGAKTHTLTTDEMPSHTHVQDAHTHTQDAHSHTLNAFPTATGGSTGFTRDTSMSGTEAATNNTTTSVTATNQNTTATNQNTGGGSAHNNLQPYIVVYFWKRTA